MITYRKLWIRLAEREMPKMELAQRAGISTATLAKLGKNEYVALSVLESICLALGCDIGDVMEVFPNAQKKPPTE